MSVAIYMTAVTHAHHIRSDAKNLEKIADALENDTMRDLGITHHDREPGFPCWEIWGVDGWFNTPLDALEAKAAKTATAESLRK